MRRLCPSGITFLGVTNHVPAAVAVELRVPWAQWDACVCPSTVPLLIPPVFAW